MSKKSKIIKDLLYLDTAKAVSLYSQLDEGIITQSQTSEEDSAGLTSNLGVDIKVFQAKIGSNIGGKENQTITRIPHHNLLNQLQNSIDKSESFIDLDLIDQDELTIEELHDKLANKIFVKATGWVNIEDYDRLKKIAERFNAISMFIQECSVEGTDIKEQYGQLKKEIKKQRKIISQYKDRNAKTKDTARLNKLEEDLITLLDENIEGGKIPQYLVDGIQLFIDTFLPNRINFRFYPYDQIPQFEILSNLKRENFVETDIENIIFSFGSRPNLKMTIFGMITSLPSENQDLFDPLSDKEDATEESIAFENAFRGVFRGFEGFEQFVRYSSYPRITTTPLAIYREIEI
ncbi:DUF6414 family protein [Tunicatimonas pelagia]|uniref:DUF6414 family protein n=1 Tax=Tunicatimonas pelagia TaxID=931531 RepID=UPI0026668BC0|nr:hypothetical protein [Tunicatimonas pelagia]WKN43572.1 hypothetical protein P0M28_01135 [Tunicatimonas pelagia]